MKFSIRDLFLVTVIVALVLGWWVDRSQLRNELDQVLMDVRSLWSAVRLNQDTPPDVREAHDRQNIREWGPLLPDGPVSSAPAPNPPKK